LIIWLEKIIYPCKKCRLATISKKTAEDMASFGRSDISVIYYGVDTDRFNPEVRDHQRDLSRASLGLPASALSLLLVGNGWRNKGLEALLEAVGTIGYDQLRLLVVGRDDPLPYRSMIARLHLDQCVTFLPLRPDVEFYYAASDVYASPSLEDAFGLPPLEAMACGLPVIVSSRAGVSELITDGVDGIVLKDPRDVKSLTKAISNLQRDPALRAALGENAERTARQYTWQRNAAQLDALFEQVLERRQNRNVSPTPVMQ
jgi:UDP-glucose:(heptosyl)LPS alpha-1,3-glucosyltransferase